MKLTPLDDRVIVALHSNPRQTAGGLHIPDNARSQHRLVRKGTVAAIGRKVSPERIREGDVVAFLNHDGHEIPEWPGFEGISMRCLREGELMFVITDPTVVVEGRHSEPEDHQNWWDKSPK